MKLVSAVLMLWTRKNPGIAQRNEDKAIERGVRRKGRLLKWMLSELASCLSQSD